MNTLVSKIAAGATIGAMTFALSLATTAPAQAFTPNVQQATDHFIECFSLMLTDPAAHAAECSPSTIPGSLASLSTPSTSTSPIVEHCYPKGKKAMRQFRRMPRPN